jgi:sigma-B regulation protein RsbU (phosphoserine phosphatase)
MTENKRSNQAAGDEMNKSKRPSFRGIYFIGLAATIIGIGVIILLNLATPIEYIQGQPTSPDQTQALHLSRQMRGIFNLAFLLLLSCPLLLFFIRKYLSPISEYFNLLHAGRESQELLDKARQHLINFPFVLIPVNLGIWILLPSALYYAAYETGHLDSRTAVILALRAIMVGFISAGIMSLWIESYARRNFTPSLFPQGRLAEVKGVARYSISRRIRLHNRLGSLIPMAILVVTVMTLQWQLDSMSISSKEYGSGILVFCLVLFAVFFITLSLLNKLLNRSIIDPLENILSVVTRIKEGDLNSRVKVVSNDEIGVLGDATNDMIQGLIERDRIQQSLNLAKEVQQNLLPRTNLKIEGFDIAGKSIYCDETGGDYYDFIHTGEDDEHKIGVAIGDVSGHGISSALLMAAVRSSLRQRSSMPGSTADIIFDVNRQLVQDVEDSGQFVTMFYLIIDPINRHLQYVRAGHDPAIFYDSNTDAFEDLGGPGMALGLDKDWNVKAHTKAALKNGQIIFLSTDGIREACNPQGEMFGKERIYEIIRQNASLSANVIINAMIESLRIFQKGAKIEDDITVVIIKITD